MEKSRGSPSAAYWKTLLDLYVAGAARVAVVSRSSFITMAMWRRRVPFVLVEAQRAGPKMTFITGEVKVFVSTWGPPEAGARMAFQMGWFKPRGAPAARAAAAAVAAVLQGGPGGG